MINLNISFCNEILWFWVFIADEVLKYAFHKSCKDRHSLNEYKKKIEKNRIEKTQFSSEWENSTGEPGIPGEEEESFKISDKVWIKHAG